MGGAVRVLRIAAALTLGLAETVACGMRCAVVALLVAILGIPAAPRGLALAVSILVVSSLRCIRRLLDIPCARTRSVRAVLMACGARTVAALSIPCVAVIGVLALRFGAAGRIAVLRAGAVVALCARLCPFAAAISSAI